MPLNLPVPTIRCTRSFQFWRCWQGTSAPGKKTGWGSQSKAMRSSLRGKTSKGKKGSKSGKGGMKRNASFAFQPGDGGFDGISGRRRSLNVRPLSSRHFDGTICLQVSFSLTDSR